MVVGGRQSKQGAEQAEEAAEQRKQAGRTRSGAARVHSLCSTQPTAAGSVLVSTDWLDLTLVWDDCDMQSDPKWIQWIPGQRRPFNPLSAEQ